MQLQLVLAVFCASVTFCSFATSELSLISALMLSLQVIRSFFPRSRAF